MKKKVLVDLSALKNIFCGFGQIALNYGRHFRENYKRKYSNYALTLLVPKNMIGEFGDEVEYISSTNFLRKHLGILFPHFDVWHSLHQLSRFSPVNQGTKHILTIHDLNYLYEYEGQKRMIKHKKMQQKVDRADEVVCISNFAKAEVEKHLDLMGKECRVIYNGVERLDLIQAKKPPYTVEKPFFFSIGVIEKKKNFHVLLDLMKLMPEKHLYIAGRITKPLKNEYAQMIIKRIEQENITNVTLLGAVSHEEKVWLYQHCEAFLFPALFEGFGLPIVEAMQFGKPVFSSDRTSLPEIGGDLSCYWGSFNPQDMKLTMDRHLDKFREDNRLALGEMEYARSFSYNRHVEEYEKIYTAL